MAENTNTERANFEAWYKTTQRIAKDLFRDGDGYMSNIADACWDAWQARASLSLPAAGQEPVARVNNDGFIVETGLLLSPGMKLYAAPQPAVAAGWMPTDSAPRDGTEFLAVYGRQGNVKQLVKWNKLHGHWESKGEWVPGFESNVTAIYPLPPAPSTEGESNG